MGWGEQGWGTYPWGEADPVNLGSTFRNLSFEDPGAEPGLADAWTFESLGTAFTPGAYDGGTEAWEDFEEAWPGQAGYLRAFGAGDMTKGLYAAHAATAIFEAFESEWPGVDAYLRKLGSATPGQYHEREVGHPDYATDVVGYESFGTEDRNGWGTEGYPPRTLVDGVERFTIVHGVDTTVDPAEPFDSPGWATLTGWHTSWGGGELTTGQYNENGTLRAYEGFEAVKFPIAFSATTPDVLTAASHGFANGDKVTLTTSGRLPAGLAEATTYYVVSAAADTLKLSNTPGGAALNFSDPGIGTHKLNADPARYWTVSLTDEE